MDQETDRARLAYETILRGFSEPQDAENFIPEWRSAPTWVRDAVRVAYMQGKLDQISAPAAK
jgi:hypothetical protein